MEQTRILIVDDEPSMRQALALALGQPGWKLDAAGTAEEALSLFEAGKYDVLIVDKNLPGKSGVQLIQEVRRRDTVVAIIMITGYATTKSAMELVQQRIDAYVEKPLDSIFGIVELVENSIRELQARRDSRRASETAGAPTADEAPTDKPKILVAALEGAELTWVTEQIGDAFELTAVATSAEANARLGDEAPDILIADATVRDPDIFTLVANSKHLPDGPQCMIIADEPVLRTVTKLILIGIDSIVSKPLDAAQFNSELERLARKPEPGAK